MCPIEDCHGPVGAAFRMKPLHLVRDPGRFRFRIVRVVAEYLLPRRAHRRKVLFDAVPVCRNQTVANRRDFRSGTVILVHQDGFRAGKFPVKIQQIPDVRSTPGIDRLIRIPDNKQILMVSAQRFHQLILQKIDILKLINKNILQPLLPFLADFRALLKNIQRNLDKVVVVKCKAFAFLIEIAAENDIFRPGCLRIAFMQLLRRKIQQIQVVLRRLKKLLDLDHVPGVGIGHVPQRKAAFRIYIHQHRVNVRIVQDQKASGIPDRVRILLQDADAEAVKSIDIAGVIVAGQIVDPLPHFICGLVCERDAQNIARENSQFIYKIREASR